LELETAESKLLKVFFLVTVALDIAFHHFSVRPLSQLLLAGRLRKTSLAVILLNICTILPGATL
jgi:hypothetical protein